MSTPDNLLFESLDAPEAELLNVDPEPAPSAPEPEPAEPAAPPAATRERDPVTGQFLPSAPAAAPDPVKAVEEPAHEKPQVVPLAAHIEERRRMQAELAELRDRLAKIESPPKAPEPEPEFIDDPKGYVDAKVGRAMESMKQVEQKAEVGAQEAQLNRFLQHVGAIEADYVKQAPDYYDALGHVRQARMTQLTEMFPQATPEQITQQIRTEELQAAAALLQQGRNPSEVVYQMAKKVYGYAPKPTAAPTLARPAVPQAPVGDPSATLGAPGGAPESGDEAELAGDDDINVVLNAALSERFKRR